MRAIVEVGPAVFALRYRFYDQQIGAIVGDDGVVLVDTRSTYPQAEEIRRDLAGLTPLPVVAVVNTHGHYDHAFGNRVFRPAPIWGHARCVEMLVETGERQRAAFAEERPALAADVAAVEIDPPDRTFDEQAIVEIAGRTIELRYLGRGHTDNDIVIVVPDARVAFAGDLLENGAAPYFGDGFPMDWPVTVERFAELDADAFVPGHGDVGDRAFVAAQLDDLRSIADLAVRVKGGELGLDDALGAAPYPRDAAREPIDRALAQLQGELDPPGT